MGNKNELFIHFTTFSIYHVVDIRSNTNDKTDPVTVLYPKESHVNKSVGVSAIRNIPDKT